MGNHERELLCFCAKRHKRAMTVLGSGGEHQPLCVCVCVFVCVCVQAQLQAESFGRCSGFLPGRSSADKGEAIVTYSSNHTVSSALREDGGY